MHGKHRSDWWCGLVLAALLAWPAGAGEATAPENLPATAVSRQRDKFYTQFEKALSISHGTHILEWIDQDVDLDVYRNEPEFKALVEKYGKILRGK